jgi:HPt (histidine-containing phosphotransfer) domain-containing protein
MFMGKSSAAAAIEVEIDEDVDARPVIDLVHLSRQTCGDSALESELLRLFANQAQQIAARIDEEPLPGDGSWRADLAHRLKGSARAVGAFPLSDAAEAYEQYVRANAPELTDAQNRLAEAIERARGAIRQLL